MSRDCCSHKDYSQELTRFNWKRVYWEKLTQQNTIQDMIRNTSHFWRNGSSPLLTIKWLFAGVSLLNNLMILFLRLNSTCHKVISSVSDGKAEFSPFLRSQQIPEVFQLQEIWQLLVVVLNVGFYWVFPKNQSIRYCKKTLQPLHRVQLSFGCISQLKGVPLRFHSSISSSVLSRAAEASPSLSDV